MITQFNADDIEDAVVMSDSLSKSICGEETVKIQSRTFTSSNPQVFTGVEDDNPRPAVNYAKMLHDAANSAFNRYLKERYNKGEENKNLVSKKYEVLANEEMDELIKMKGSD